MSHIGVSVRSQINCLSAKETTIISLKRFKDKKKVKMILSYNYYTLQCGNYSFKCNAELWFVLIDAHTF